MRTRKRMAGAALGALLLATALYAVLAAPGLLTDAASTGPASRQVATVRP